MFSIKKKELGTENILEALKKVIDPDLHRDIVSLGMVSDVKIQDGGKVSFKLTLTTPACPLKEKIEADCMQALKAVAGVTEVEIESAATVANQRLQPAGKESIPGIKNIIAVTSGKGGVGKTTVAINIATALAHLGSRVGILDADVTGPNVPLMLGVDKEQPQAKDNRIKPIENYGVKCISMAFFVAKDTPIIWRGPMLDKAIRQFLRDVDWGELDYLIVDMPPGTGDAQLTMVQATQMAGGVIVTTPQEVAVLDGRKGMAMFKQMNVPVFGFVENMSYFQPPGTTDPAQRINIFGHGGGKRLAEEMQVPFLGEIPLDQAVREGGDEGKPIVVMDPMHPVSQAFIAIAKQLAAQASIHALGESN